MNLISHFLLVQLEKGQVVILSKQLYIIITISIIIIIIIIKVTSHLSVKLTAIRVTVNEVSSHLCKVLTLIIVRAYLQDLLKLAKTFVSPQKFIRFPLDTQVEMAFITEIITIFQFEHLYASPLTCSK